MSFGVGWPCPASIERACGELAPGSLYALVKNLWNDGSGLAFDDAGDPTAYFWVHLLLAVTSFALGTVIGVLGLRGMRAARRDTGHSS